MGLSLRGMTIRVNPLFLAAFLLYYAAGVLDRAVIAFGSVLLHEMGHVLAASGFGVRVKSVELFPFGGVARFEGTGILRPAKEIGIALGGPLTSVALFCVGQGLVQYGCLGGARAQFFLAVNLMIAAFNLLPGLPLDGGRIMRALLTTRKGSGPATSITAITGQIIGFLLTVLGIGGFVAHLWGLEAAAAGLFILYAATSEKRQAAYLFAHNLVLKERELSERLVLPGELLVAVEEALLIEVSRLFNPGRFYFIAVTDKNGNGVGLLSETEVIAALTSLGSGTQIGLLLKESRRCLF
ncbi:MAG: M50 family metallopeptidase [Bacillota bacterium]